MEPADRDQGSTFIYQRLGWEIRDGGPEADGAPLIVPKGADQRKEPPLVLAAIALRAALADEAEHAPLKAHKAK